MIKKKFFTVLYVEEYDSINHCYLYIYISEDLEFTNKIKILMKGHKYVSDFLISEYPVTSNLQLVADEEASRKGQRYTHTQRG